MEDMIMMKKHTCMSNKSSPSSSSSPLAMHKNSQTISKTKPKIRIIHIFAPEIIRTDVENFRELVQRLTGKPSVDSENDCKVKKPRVVSGSRKNHHHHQDQSISKGSSTSSNVHEYCDESQLYSGNYMNMTMKMDRIRNGFWGLDPIREINVKEEERVWNGDHQISGRFEDFEGFITSELGESPLLPLDGTHDHMHGFGETQLS
ncbi:VQ motif-containing protein [Quillaja saponaria]|uniref:VQ motif-containing protein n=1 Tax=Quillaja saponaria TaxID=32244 RepID=A0AAD7Q712_QUISA|nr:VQ motif-containing protein [Quillaja saponaria]